MGQSWRVEGTVVAAATLRPVAGATVKVIGRMNQFTGVAGVVADPTEGIEWTRTISGFSGSRWDLWDKKLKTVPGLTWAQFMNDALIYNPQLSADGRVFQVEKSYLVPENTQADRGSLSIKTAADGRWSFPALPGPTSLVLEVSAPGFTTWRTPIVINQNLNQPVQLAGTRNMRSLLPNYATLPVVVRKVVDQALAMLGDDAAVFDSLVPELQKMAYGSRFLNDPNNFNYKDIVCADLVSICFTAAGVPINWKITQPAGEVDSLSKANHYRPGVPQLIEITDPNDWLPGDVLCYWRGDFATSRLGHVNLYVGPFAGTDLSGVTYTAAQNVDVVESSMDWMSGGKEVGQGIIACTKSNCLERKRGWEQVRRVRLAEIAKAFGR